MSIKSILVVCVGNICRSPMAQALLVAALPDARIVSAGTHALVGEAADPKALQLMAARGVDISSHRAQQVGRVLCQQAEVVLAMDRQQCRYLETQYPFITGRVFRLGEFSKVDIPDPYRQSNAMFEHSLGLIDASVSAWIDRLNRI